MKKLPLTSLVIAAVAGGLLLVPDVALAAPADQIQSGVTSVGGDSSADLGAMIKNIVNILFFVLGAIAVVMIVIGGIKYTTSNGDAGSIKSAKDTILYSVVGLIVALISYAIVQFVINAFA